MGGTPQASSIDWDFPTTIQRTGGSFDGNPPCIVKASIPAGAEVPRLGMVTVAHNADDWTG